LARRPGILARLFPFAVIATAAVVLFVVWTWPDTDVDTSKLTIIKILTILIAFGLLLFWALRLSGFKKRFVWLGVLVLIGLPMMIWKPQSMNGKFFPIFVARDWILDTFFDGSPDTQLERHRAQHGKAGGPAELIVKAGDWPAFRGPERDGIVVGPKIARDWTKNPPREIWRQPIGGGYAAFAIANGFLVTIEQRRDREVVVCYEAATGKEVWTTGWETRFSETAGGDGPRATPTIADVDVFAFGANGRLVCLDGRDGKEKWAVETLEGNSNLRWGMSGSPLVLDNLVVVHPGAQKPAAQGKAVQAYDRSSGKLVWQSGDHPTAYCSPQLSVLGGEKQILIFDAHGVAGLNPKNGDQLWRVEWKTDYDINVAQPVIVSDDTVMIASGYNKGGTLLRVTKEGDTWKPSQVWRSKNSVLRYKFTNGVRRKTAEGDYIYGLNDGYLECVDLKTGRQVWKDERRPRDGEGWGHGQILLCDDLIVGLTEETREMVLVEATPEAYRELGRIKVFTRGKKAWNNPAMAHGRIYIRNEEEMVCYDLTGQ
jgi:outer membrane protein assembly factor BamB